MNHNVKTRGSGPKKSLGQFFLRDKITTLRIAKSISDGFPVIEIGPGDGALTWALLDIGRAVTAVELDPELVEQLSQRFSRRRDFRVIRGDILQVGWESLTDNLSEIVIVGNLPYHLTAPILFSVFERVRNNQPPKIVEMVVMIQKEVAQRLVAVPKSKAFGSLTLLASYHASIDYLFEVPAKLFYPRPKVDGAVIKLRFHNPEDRVKVDYPSLRRVVRGSFAQRRKMMRNSLGVVNNLPDNWRDIPYDLTRRPEEFTLEEFADITNILFPMKEE